MRLHELIAEADIEAMLIYLVAERPFEAKSEDGYRQAVAELKTMEPVAGEMTIVVEREPANLIDPPSWRVAGISPDGSRWALDLTPWAQMLGMGVLAEGCDLTSEQLLAHVLWEMTFYGFSDAAVQEAADTLGAISDDLDAKLAMLPENPTDQDYEAVGLHVLDIEEPQ